MEENVTAVEMPKKRPTFLTVLCILSFIGSGGGFLYYVYNYFTFENTYSEQVAKFTEAVEMMEDNGADSGFLYNSAVNKLVELNAMNDNLDLITGAFCLFALLSFIGAIMMWKLKKNGFYLYTFTNVFALLIPLALIDFNAMLMNTLIGAIFTIIFIIMYAVNLKHMK
ncbi:hypothetical protein [Marinifilum flexuosum]|uniref:hypothetical protein n=1 Tax=Marinifilum flexuosum TaxID=1117708 RepID=UPI002491356F|nr:hypothetical protein [Marinifilum flexuosum]